MEQFQLNDFTNKVTDEPQIVVKHPYNCPLRYTLKTSK